MLTRVTQFTGLVGLPIKPDMLFFLVSGPLIFLIVYFYFFYSTLNWLRNEIHGLFFSTFYIVTISNKCFFRVDT
jgi:hypothetical protein